jgi:hypothetical protein
LAALNGRLKAVLLRRRGSPGSSTFPAERRSMQRQSVYDPLFVCMRVFKFGILVTSCSLPPPCFQVKSPLSGPFLPSCYSPFHNFTPSPRTPLISISPAQFCTYRVRWEEARPAPPQRAQGPTPRASASPTALAPPRAAPAVMQYIPYVGSKFHNTHEFKKNWI